MSKKKNILKNLKSNKKTFRKKIDNSNKELKLNDKELLTQSLNNFKEKHLRLRAEYDNYIKRSEKEISRILKYDGENVIKFFLSISDDLTRVINSSKNQKSKYVIDLVNGIKLIQDKLKNKLKSVGVESFDSKDSKFDPELHDAMMTKESKDYDDSIIIEEFEKGYKYKDKVIRHSKVIVNSIQSKENKS